MLYLYHRKIQRQIAHLPDYKVCELVRYRITVTIILCVCCY